MVRCLRHLWAWWWARRRPPTRRSDLERLTRPLDADDWQPTVPAPPAGWLARRERRRW